MEEESEKQEKVAWNLAQHVIQEIAYLMNRSSQAYVIGNVTSAMFYLQAIALRISAHFTPDEQTGLNNIEKEFWEAAGKSKPKGFDVGDSKERTTTYAKHKEYNNELMSCLKKYGYLVPKKEDRTDMG